VVSSSGQLGVAPSSARFKREIRDLDDESRSLSALRPVAFKYDRRIDPAGRQEYGLIAEEVAKVRPELVEFDRAGRPFTVRYQQVNALLLAEVNQQRRIIADLERRLARLEHRAR
jgi:hypothetical protein